MFSVTFTCVVVLFCFSPSVNCIGVPFFSPPPLIGGGVLINKYIYITWDSKPSSNQVCSPQPHNNAGPLIAKKEEGHWGIKKKERRETIHTRYQEVC